MSTTLKSSYGSVVTMTCSLHKDAAGANNGLPSNNAAGREATAISNATDVAVDVLIQLVTKLQAGTPANDQTIYIYAYGVFDGAEAYPDGITGADSYVTFNANQNFVEIGHINTPTANQVYKSNMFSVAAAFGGELPSKWGLVIVNYSGCQLTGTAGDHTLKYQEKFYQNV